jgi:hypothetical protein
MPRAGTGVLKAAKLVGQSGRGITERRPEVARDAVRGAPEVIFTFGNEMAQIPKEATLSPSLLRLRIPLPSAWQRAYRAPGALPVPMVIKRSSIAFIKWTFAAIATTPIATITKTIRTNRRRRAVFVMRSLNPYA